MRKGVNYNPQRPAKERIKDTRIVLCALARGGQGVGEYGPLSQKYDTVGATTL